MSESSSENALRSLVREIVSKREEIESTYNFLGRIEDVKMKLEKIQKLLPIKTVVQASPPDYQKIRVLELENTVQLRLKMLKPFAYTFISCYLRRNGETFTRRESMLDVITCDEGWLDSQANCTSFYQLNSDLKDIVQHYLCDENVKDDVDVEVDLS